MFGALVAAGLDPAAASLASYSSGVGSSYLLNARLTFGFAWAELASGRRAVAFIAVNLIGLIISTSVVAALSGALGPLPAKLLSLLTTFGWNFTMSRRTAFGR